jgi:Transposase DDE domain group 1
LLLRKGSAGSNTVTDHIEVLTEAITQIPARYRRDLLITVDGAGASHGLVEHITKLTALLRHGPHGDQLASWPADMRIICRREKPHPGAQLSLFETADGWRYQLLATNTPGKSAQFLEACHRPHARVEDTIRCGKQTGLGHLPSTSIEIKRAWCLAAAIACDLLCWLRLLCLDGPLARAKPKTLRYREPSEVRTNPTNPMPGLRAIRRSRNHEHAAS